MKILYNDVNCEKGCVKEVRACLSKRQVILNLLDEIGSFKLVKEHKHVFITLMKYADDITSTLAGFQSDLKNFNFVSIVKVCSVCSPSCRNLLVRNCL